MIYMGTTQIEAEKTASEIIELLGKYGATHIVSQYEGGKITGLSFIIEYNKHNLHFKLPVRWEPVLKIMGKDKHTPRRLCSEEQAKRVAWRQVKRWIESQLALVEVNMVDIKEVFMPYLIVKNNRSFYEDFVDKRLALPSSDTEPLV
jgi:hypothetical protein